MATTTTNWRVPLWAWFPLGLAISAEAIANSLRAYGLGTHLEAFTVPVWGQSVSLAGAVLVAAAVAVSLSQARAIWVAIMPGLWRQRIVAWPIGILLLAISVTAMASTLLEAERAKVADEGGERGKFDRAKLAYDKAAAELKTLDAIRTTDQVNTAMDAAKVSAAAWKWTEKCTNFEDDFASYRKACKPILDLRIEMASAIRKGDLEIKVEELKAELDAQPRPQEVTASEVQVAGVWAWIMGFGVIFIATFGSVIFAQPELVTEPKAERSNKQPSEPNRGSKQTSYPANDDELPNPGQFGKPSNRPPNWSGGGRTVRQFSKREAAADVVTRLALGERFASQDEMKKRYGRAKSTISDWLGEWERSGLIPARTQLGRCKQLERAD